MANSNICINVSNISVILGNKTILDNVSFDCFSGEWTLIFGKTGEGKSTLLRAVNGLASLSNGNIAVLGSHIPGRSSRQARMVWQQTGTVLQEVALFESKTVLENVTFPLHSLGVPKKETDDEAMYWLQRLKLENKAKDYPSQLSGGECQRVALARSFIINPRLLILDEPTSALDRMTADNILLIIKQFSQKGATILMASHHNIKNISELCDKQFELKMGKLYNYKDKF